MGWGTWGRQAGPGTGNLGEGPWGGVLEQAGRPWGRQVDHGVVRWALGQAGGPWRVPFSCKLSSMGLCRQ